VAQKRAHKTRKAVEDLAEIAAWYGRESIDLELRFFQAMEDAFQGLVVSPRKGTPRTFDHPALRDIRMWPVPAFPRVLIFCRTFAGRIEVIRVLRVARDIATLLSKEGEID
jgi:plasmid stabilization system protein ParE